MRVFDKAIYIERRNKLEQFVGSGLILLAVLKTAA
jgi:hypothetical protein